VEAAAFWHGGERQSERLSDPAWTVEKVAALQDSMTSDTARALRESWEKAGNMFCDHLVLILQTSEEGNLTEQYICARR